MTEEQLARHITCPMGDWKPDPLERPAMAAFRWAALKRMDAIIVEPEPLRERFVKEWHADWGDRKREGKDYWKGPRVSGAFARRVYNLFLRYVVLQPFEPYTLEMAGGDITGHAAILGKDDNRGRLKTYALSPRLRAARDRRTPDYVAFARWLALRQEVDTVDLFLLHQPLLSGEGHADKNLNERLVRGWLQRVVDEHSSELRPPSYGAHCTHCTQPCTEMLTKLNRPLRIGNGTSISSAAQVGKSAISKGSRAQIVFRPKEWSARRDTTDAHQLPGPATQSLAPGSLVARAIVDANVSQERKYESALDVPVALCDRPTSGHP